MQKLGKVDFKNNTINKFWLYTLVVGKLKFFISLLQNPSLLSIFSNLSQWWTLFPFRRRTTIRNLRIREDTAKVRFCILCKDAKISNILLLFCLDPDI